MSRLMREKKGQFIIIAALLIAALTLATTISIHEISIQRLSIAYRPVDEFLLGTTSDLSRVLAASLANYTSGIITQNLTGSEAGVTAAQLTTNWTESMLTSYSSYGITMDDPFLPGWDCDWNDKNAYSLCSLGYAIDVNSYDFKGWMGRSYKFVQLQILPETIQSDSATSSFNFTLKESSISEDALVPVPALPQNPNTQSLRVGNYTSGQQFAPATNVSLYYYGNGTYRVTFNQLVSQTTQGIRLDLATPTDGIWVSANNYVEPDQEPVGDWSKLHLISDGNDPVLQPEYLYVPAESHFYAPTLNQGHTQQEVSTKIPTPVIVTAPIINITTYVASVPPKAQKYLTLELNFTHNNQEYRIGTATITVCGGSSPKLYSVSIDANFDYGFGQRTIPANSAITLTFTITFGAQSGSGWIYVDGTTPSQIYLY